MVENCLSPCDSSCTSNIAKIATGLALAEIATNQPKLRWVEPMHAIANMPQFSLSNLFFCPFFLCLQKSFMCSSMHDGPCIMDPATNTTLDIQCTAVQTLPSKKTSNPKLFSVLQAALKLFKGSKVYNSDFCQMFKTKPKKPKWHLRYLYLNRGWHLPVSEWSLTLNSAAWVETAGNCLGIDCCWVPNESSCFTWLNKNTHHYSRKERKNTFSHWDFNFLANPQEDGWSCDWIRSRKKTYLSFLSFL